MSTQDTLYQQLVDLGYTGTLNDMEYQWLLDQGYTGTLQDMLKAEAISSGFLGQNMNLMMLGSTGQGAVAISPVALVGTASDTLTSSAETWTFTFPDDITFEDGYSALNENDIVLVVSSLGGFSLTIDTLVTTSGYTEFIDDYANDTNDTWTVVSWKRMGVTPDTSLTITNSGATGNTPAGSVQVYVFRNCRTDASPIGRYYYNSAILNGSDTYTPPMPVVPNSALFYYTSSYDLGATPISAWTTTNWDNTWTTDTDALVEARGHRLVTGYEVTPSETLHGLSDAAHIIEHGTDGTDSSTCGFFQLIAEPVGTNAVPSSPTVVAYMHDWNGESRADTTLDQNVTTDLSLLQWVEGYTGLLEDDIVLAFMYSSQNSQNTGSVTFTTSGYTNEVAWQHANDDRDALSGLWYKVMGASPDTDIQWSSPSAANIDRTYGITVVVVRGGNTSTPFTNSAGSTTVNSGLANPPSVTTVDGSIGIYLAHAAGDDLNYHEVPWTGDYAAFTMESSGRNHNMIAYVGWEATDGTALDPGAMTMLTGSTDSVSNSGTGITVSMALPA